MTTMEYQHQTYNTMQDT